MFNIQTIRKGRGPLFPPSNPMIWLDGSDASTMEIATNVSRWSDKTGNGFDATQATGSRQPTLTGNIVNGLSSLFFNGSNIMSISSVSIATFSIFAIFKISSSGLVYEISSNANSNPGSYLNTSTNQTILVHKSGALTDASCKDYTTNWGSTNVAMLAGQIFDGTDASHQLYVNNNAVSLIMNFSINPGTDLMTQPLFIGARDGVIFPITGYISEFIVYNRALSIQEINNVNNYLNNKWRVY